MVNINEFYEANLGFNIVSEDACFGDDGELEGVRSVENTRYREGGGERVNWDATLYRFVVTDPNPERETLQGDGIEDGAMLDDDGSSNTEFLPITEGLSVKSRIASDECTGPNRWAHERDMFEAERKAEALTLSKRDRLWDSDGTRVPMYGEMEYYAIDRRRRFARVTRHLAKLPKAHRARARREVWHKYKDSVRQCARHEQWYMLVFTRAQVDELMNLLRGA